MKHYVKQNCAVYMEAAILTNKTVAFNCLYMLSDTLNMFVFTLYAYILLF